MTYIPGRGSHRRKERDKTPESRRDEEPRKEYIPANDIDILKLKNAHEELADTHRTLRESQAEMIFRFAIAAEYKDGDTGSHIMRISDYSTEMGNALGLSHHDLECLRYASPMHDIGKLGIPDKILQKPGKLDDSEWEVMKQHTIIGFNIFKGSHSPLLKAAAEIALTHHEKFDGSGYPDGLKAEHIPIFGRIVALLDVFDAVISKRCYKTASTFEEGMKCIEELSNSHLDPDLVKVFMKLEGKMFKIYSANKSIQQYVKDEEIQ